MIKSVFLSGLITAPVATVIGSQGSRAGPLAIERLQLADQTVFWSWPLFVAGFVLWWGLSLLQR